MKMKMKMKKFIFIKPLLIVVLVALLSSNCKQDDTLYTGKLEVTFVNHPYDLRVNILSLDNNNVAIFYDLTPDANGVVTKDLNYGKYIVAPSSLSTYYGNSGFQIQVGKTTKVSYDQYNGSHVH